MADVTKQVLNLFARSGGSVEPGKSVASQGGILEGQDPSHYDPKNPVRRTASRSNTFDELTEHRSDYTLHHTGLHHPLSLPRFTLSSRLPQGATGRRRGAGRYPSGAISVRSNSRIHGHYISTRVNPQPEQRSKPRTDPFPFHHRSRSRSTLLSQ